VGYIPLSGDNRQTFRGSGGVEKVLFNHKEHKVGTKYTKVNLIFQIFVTFV